MKKCMLWLFALAVLTTPLHAGGIGLMAAHWDSNQADNDEGGGIRVTVDLGPRWNLEVRGSWLDSFFRIGDGLLFRMEAFPVDVALSYGFETGGSVEPYVGAGFTYLDISPVVVDPEIRRRIEVNTPEEAGVFFLVGVDFPVTNRIALFVEGTYRNIKAHANSTDIQDFTLDMTGGGANAGLVLRF